LTTAGEHEHGRRDSFLDNITAGVTPSSIPWSVPSSEATGVALSSAVRRSLVNGKSHRRTVPVFGDDVVCGDTLSEDDDHNFVTHFLAKTNLGSERYCGAEMQEVVDAARLLDPAVRAADWKVIAKPHGLDGFVALTTSSSRSTISKESRDRTASILLKMRSVHHILLYHTHFNLSECTTAECPTPELVSGETLYRYFKNVLVEKAVVLSTLEDLGEGSFRVSCDRIGGPHAFHYAEVAAEVGGAISEYYAPNITPKMKDYDVCIRSDVVGNWVVLGTQLNVEDMSKDRHFLKFRNAVTIKTNLAYDMVRLGDIKDGDFVVDPFCGSGTLLLEALEVYQKRIFCFGLDVSRRSADGARDNAVTEGYGSDVCNFVCADVRAIRRHVKDEQVDAMITNMPWGVRTGDKNVKDLRTMYETFLRTSWYVLKPGARLVMLVLRGLQVSRIVRKLSGRYRLLSINVIR
jgi:23S rRNA G2445 N2-methylase RlmL